MKFFIVFTAALAVASAGHLYAPIAYGAQHLPVIGPNGVPIDTPAVQHATAAHLAHKAEAHARNGDFAVVAHAAPLAYAHHAIAAPVVAAHVGHVGHVGIPETAEVVAAKHAHFAAHAEALARNGHVASIHHLYKRGIFAAAAPVVAHAVPAAYPTTLGLPAVTANGVPLETPEVVAAKSNHFAAHAEALTRTGHVYGAVTTPIVAHAAIAAPVVHAHHAVVAAAPQHLPVIGANGVPVDTPAVQHARAAHLAHKVEAHARNGDLAVVAHAAPVVHAHHAVAAPLAYGHHGIAAPVVAHAAIAAHAVPAAYPTTLGLPAVTANGVPLETPEVVAAKSNHFAAHHEALARNSPIISEAIVAAPVASLW